MGERRILVGVVGESHECRDEAYASAVSVGRELSSLGAVVLSGAAYRNRKGQSVKNGALEHAAASVSIVPKGRISETTLQQDGAHLELDARLTSYERNIMTGQVPDVLIAIGGGVGTLSEIAYGLADGRNVVLLAPGPRDLSESRIRLTPESAGSLAAVDAEVQEKWATEPVDLQAILEGRHFVVTENATVAASAAIGLGERREGRHLWKTRSDLETDQKLEEFAVLLERLLERPPG